MPELPAQQIAGYTWLAFTSDTPMAEAQAIFKARYGREAAMVGFSLGNVLVGPLHPQEVTP